MDIMDFNPIAKYNLDDAETKAYRLYLVWLDKSRKMFPEYNHPKQKKGDPRKSIIWKYCYKVIYNFGQALKEEDYPLYIRSQLEIIKYYNKEAMIDASCLVGDKAWIRWKIWKKKYDEKTKTINYSAEIKAPSAKVIHALRKTKEFIEETYGKAPKFTEFEEKTRKNFEKWVNLKKISPYYILLSPYIQRIYSKEELTKLLNFDLELYRVNLTPELENIFKELFPYE